MNSTELAAVVELGAKALREHYGRDDQTSQPWPQGVRGDECRQAVHAVLDVVLPMLVERIEGELVCCDIHERLEALAKKWYDSLDLKPDEPLPAYFHEMSPEWRELHASRENHPMCRYGAWAAALIRYDDATPELGRATAPRPKRGRNR